MKNVKLRDTKCGIIETSFNQSSEHEVSWSGEKMANVFGQCDVNQLVNECI